MNRYLKAAGIVLGSHLVRTLAEYMYYMKCGGFVNSIFSYGSPTCRGLRWVAETSMANIHGVAGLLSVFQYKLSG